MDRLRRTGRTSRMLLRAAEMFLSGKNVLVVTHSMDSAHQMKARVLDVIVALGIQDTMIVQGHDILYKDHIIRFSSMGYVRGPSYRERSHEEVIFDHYLGGDDDLPS